MKDRISVTSRPGGIAAVILVGVAVFAGITLRGVSAQADLSDAEH
ncbi:hypothetical protein [Flexivirga aerilata]|nr:hypothetical protein [Flexivirga aerilata]